jgi:hypothetical protein
VPNEHAQILREYRAYDARVDIVSCFEVFFTKSTSLPASVAHFERFPRYVAEDGRPVSPDFTVLFRDGTLLVGEIANLARNDESLKDLLVQIGRYDTLREGPASARRGGGHVLAPVAGVDVLVVFPDAEANAACDRIDAVIEARRWGYNPSQRPTVMAWSFDPPNSRYVFKYDDRANNPRPRTHGRDPSITSWLRQNSDTLRCSGDHFTGVKVTQRFMNDRPPPLYMATILWLTCLPAVAAPSLPPIDVSATATELADWLRANVGWGDADAVRAGLDFLCRAGLAVERRDDWVIPLTTIGRSHGEVQEELLRRYLSKPTGPVTLQERAEQLERGERKARQRHRDLDAQTTLSDGQANGVDS